MAQLKLIEVRDLIGSILPEYNSLIYSNTINRDNPTSIGVFTAPESRMGNTGTFGGEELSPVKKFPINILVRWSDDSSEAEARANEVYNSLNSLGQNFLIRLQDYNSIKISFVRMLDSHPVWIGRDDKNICEYTIRVDFFYYQ